MQNLNKEYLFLIKALIGLSQKIGAEVEQQALGYLQQQGASLIQQNFRCRIGEIDLIMQAQGALLFIEVRFRKNVQFGSAVESINWQKRQKIIRSAQFFLRKFPNFQYAPCRFDVLAARLDAQELCFEWIQNAFQAF